MASAVRKWVPLMLIAAATAASVAVYDRVPPSVALQLEGMLPFEVSTPARPLSREFALFLIPALTLIVWAAFRSAPTAVGQRFGRRLFRNAPEAVTSAEQFDRFGKTYDSIVLGVVLLLIGFHAAVLADLLTHSTMAARIIAIVLGASLVLMGNVMPRLRPNWVAGLRTKRMLEDPQLWRAAHRAFGTAFVVSGILTMTVGLVAPRYGLVAGVATMVASLVVGWVASIRRSIRVPPAALVMVGLLCARPLAVDAQSADGPVPVVRTAPSVASYEDRRCP